MTEKENEQKKKDYRKKERSMMKEKAIEKEQWERNRDKRAGGRRAEKR